MNQNPQHEVYSSIRTTTYQTRWGEPEQTWERQVAGKPIKFHLHRIEVQKKESSPVESGYFFVLFTDGLSDEAYVENEDKTEFLMYIAEMQDVYLEWLSFLITVQMVDKVDLFQRTVPMTVEPSNLNALSEDSCLSSCLVMNSVITRDGDPFSVGGIDTYTLWVVPISEQERKLVNEEGLDALMDLFNEKKHPYVLDPGRKSYV